MRAWIATLALFTHVGVAQAQPGRDTPGAAPSSQERVLAESLFREARELVKAEDFDAACPKLAESQRLDPQLGTLLYLATCHEQQGKTASAWAEYSAAADLAAQRGEVKRQALARERADALEPKLARIKVRLSQSSSSLTVTLDGRAIGSATLATPFPIDPGDHRLSASAKDGASWKQAVRIPEGAGTTTVEVPLLERRADTSGAGDDGDDLRTGAWIAGGVGVAGLGLMTVFGIVAINQRGAADEHCVGQFCSDEGLAGHADASTSAVVSTVGLFVGLAGLATATTLFIIAASPPDQQEAYWMAPSLTPDGGMLRAGMRW
jgi:hypothetical protein